MSNFMSHLSFLEDVSKNRTKRIKILLEREGIDQQDLAHDIGMWPQNFCRCMVSDNVSEKTCKKIAERYPKYRLNWLLGYDDSMTDYEWAENIQHKKDQIADSMWSIIENSLNKKGNSLKFVHRSGQHIDSSERLNADCYYSVVDREERQIKRLSALEMVEFEQKIQEYCDFLTEKYLVK